MYQDLSFNKMFAAVISVYREFHLQQLFCGKLAGGDFVHLSFPFHKTGSAINLANQSRVPLISSLFFC